MDTDYPGVQLQRKRRKEKKEKNKKKRKKEKENGQSSWVWKAKGGFFVELSEGNAWCEYRE
jgi:hypothetical protein